MQSTLCKQQQTDRFQAADYWVKDLGASLHFWKLLPFDRLPYAKQLLFILLGNHADITVNLNGEKASATVEQELAQLIQSERLGSYILHRLQQPDLLQYFGSYFSEDFKNSVRTEAAAEILAHEQVKRSCAQLWACLEEMQDSIVWLKGPGIAASVYPEPHQRSFADFDLLCTPASLENVVFRLEENGYLLDKRESALYRAGPLREVSDLFLHPSKQFVCCDALTFIKDRQNSVEIKLDPLENGLWMHDRERVHREAVQVRFGSKPLRCPSLADQLLIACCHLHKDHFHEYRRLLDIHLLVEALNSSNFDWARLLDSIEKESLNRSVWAALCLCADRLGTKVDTNFLSSIKPNITAQRALAYTIHYRFLWNQNSFATLLLSTIFLDPDKRKLRCLIGSFFPERKFLAQYYLRRAQSQPLFWLLALLMHWYVVLMPAGVVRRTLGLVLWPTPSDRLVRH